MTEMYDCPAEGCDYTGLKSSVLGHYSGKRDDAHSGGYEYARHQLEGESTSSAAPTESDGGTPNTSSGNPALGGPTPDPKPQDGDSDDGGAEGAVSLPCGHQSYDPTEAPDPPFSVSCDECGTSWKVMAE